jgi:DNA replication protein DnaC
MKTQLDYEAVRRALEDLHLSSALAILESVLEAARVEALAPVEVLARLLDVELAARHDRRVETNLKFAGLPYRQRLEEFEFDAQPSVDPSLVGRLATLQFLEEGTNVLVLGPPGVGKTALAVGLGIKALEAGHRIYFIACHDLVGRFRRAVRMDRTDRLLTMLLRPRLLILDEVGYTPLERPEATFLFEVVAKRYDRRKSMIVTSNKSWGAWGEILPDQVMTAAILDRLLHRSVTLNIQGESYRLRQHRKAGLAPLPLLAQKGGAAPADNLSNLNR